MEMLLLLFVRSIRTEDLFLYEKSLDEIADWVFILDHYNYARWLPVHVRDMMNVRVKHPALYRQFADGFFTIAKPQNTFAMIGFDQTHEQQNKELKMHGGTLNLSDECVFTKWAVAGPEIARVITEFEAGMYTRKNAVLKHHDHSPSVQQTFFAHTKALVIAFQEAGNPFDADSHEVVIIYTREVMPDNVARSIMDAHGEGKTQHADFVEHRLQSAAVAFHEPIKMNKINLPGNRHKNLNKSKHVDSTKEDIHLLGQLYRQSKSNDQTEGGAGIRQGMRHGGNGKCPRNWNSYLQNGSIKVELFHYLSVAIAETVFCEGKVVTSTLDEDVLGESCARS